MKVEVRYTADDGKVFESESECRNYEQKLKSESAVDMQRTMRELDVAIWNKFYPNDTTESEPALYIAYIWLKNDIVHILADDSIDTAEAEKEILSMIAATKYGEEILSRYVVMDDIKAEVKIRTDYLSALMKVKEGSDLADKIGYVLGKRDLKQLARLHKSNKCRKKIESLLTCCNFHYECGKFMRREYSEFLEEVGGVQ